MAEIHNGGEPQREIGLSYDNAKDAINQARAGEYERAFQVIAKETGTKKGPWPSAHLRLSDKTAKAFFIRFIQICFGSDTKSCDICLVDLALNLDMKI